MRCRVILEPRKSLNTIPINYNSAVAQFVYELLEPDRPFDNYTSSTTPNEGILFYTFSNLYIPEVRQRDRLLEFDQVEIELTISLLVDEPQEKEVLERMNSIAQIDSDAFGPGENGVDNAKLIVKRIEILPEILSFGPRCKFRMLSPLVAAGSRHPHYQSEEFSEAIRECLISKYTRWKGMPPEDTRFRFYLDDGYVQRRRGRISKLVTFNEMSEDERRIKALISPFECEGNPELIWLGYVAGFGEKNVLGFGCSEPVSESARSDRSGQQTRRSAAPKLIAMHEGS
jgi:CRISPR-associated endoribonuclease Cas6